jgi:hypothetical protein
VESRRGKRGEEAVKDLRWESNIPEMNFYQLHHEPNIR